MHGNSRVRVAQVARPDLHPAEGIIAGVAISAMLWMMLLVSLY